MYLTSLRGLMNRKTIQLTMTDELQSRSKTEKKLPLSSKLQLNNVRYPRKETTADWLKWSVSLMNHNRETEQIHTKANVTKQYGLVRSGRETNISSRSPEKGTSQDLVPDNPPIDGNREDSCMTCYHHQPEKTTGDVLLPKSYSCPAILDIPAASVPPAGERELTKTMVIGSSNREELKTHPDQYICRGSDISNAGNYKEKSRMGRMSFRHLAETLVQQSKVKPKMRDEVLDTRFHSEEIESLDSKISFKNRTRDIFIRSLSYESLGKETMREIMFSSDAITPSERARAKYSAKTSGGIDKQDYVVSAPLLPMTLSDPLVSEFWRLATFKDAVDVPVFVQRLAQSGFYYNEDLNDILCFSCGVSKRHWHQGDRPALVHLHLSPKCPQANSSDSRNIPITTMYQPRVTCPTRSDTTSFSDQPHLVDDHRYNTVTSIQSPTASEKEPNSSNKDSNSSNTTRLSSENTGSVSVTSFAEVVSSSSSATPRILSSPCDATEVTSQLEQTSMSREETTDGEQAKEESQDQKSQLVACDSSLCRPSQINPHDVTYSQRLLTFTTWSSSTPSPSELAEAGFSYLGVGDSVRCFSCSLTLKNWTGELTPWVAHVVYRSSCDFVRSVKGEDFVTTTLVTFGRAQHKAVGNSPRMQTHEATVYISHVSHSREATATGSKLHSLAAQGGVPCDSGSLTSDSRPEMTGTRIQVDAVHEILTCRKCRHREVDTVLLPCGHLCACSACASETTQCLVCLQTVMATVLVQQE